ncbi:MAG: protein-glutamate O-methyltransferase CheR [Gemmatimonadaceae bacterium]|nr:protein-glutamate O-methyltransferase CheR [Gemmatimonadaceae bacterium]
MTATDDAGFTALTAKITRDRGFGCGGYKDSCLRRRIAVRMRARGAADFDAYARLLDHDPAEYDKLLDALTINVTKLFRNPDVFAFLAAEVIPTLWRAPGPIRVWSAGSSSGEEAYTLAALFDAHASALGARAADRVTILGSDIDRGSLARAEAGAYAPAAFSETPAAMRSRYFSADAPHRASDALRALVRFERRDLLLDPLPAGPMQLVLCRNVIIYFDKPTQDALMQRFHDALAPRGYLVLGKVETLLGPTRTLFDTVDARQRVFRRP